MNVSHFEFVSCVSYWKEVGVFVLGVLFVDDNHCIYISCVVFNSCFLLSNWLYVHSVI
jgi:hypothetical protein